MKTSNQGCAVEQPNKMQILFDQLPKGIRELADDIYVAYTTWAASDATLRWRIGKLVTEVAKTAKRGDGAVGKIADALGCSKDKLYQCMRVAQAWPESIDQLFRSADQPRNTPLEWSHLVELVRVKEREERDTLLNQTLAQGWTVDDLRKAITSTKGTGKSKKDGESSDETKQKSSKTTRKDDTESGAGQDGSRSTDERYPGPVGVVLKYVHDWTEQQEKALPELLRINTSLCDDMENDVREAALADLEGLLHRRRKVDQEIGTVLEKMRSGLAKRKDLAAGGQRAA